MPDALPAGQPRAHGAACERSRAGTHAPWSCGSLALLLRPCSPRFLRNPALAVGVLCAFCPISLPPSLPTHIRFISVLLQDPFSGSISFRALNGETSLVVNPQGSSENGWVCLQSIKMEARPCLKKRFTLLHRQAVHFGSSAAFIHYLQTSHHFLLILLIIISRQCSRQTHGNQWEFSPPFPSENTALFCPSPAFSWSLALDETTRSQASTFR